MHAPRVLARMALIASLGLAACSGSNGGSGGPDGHVDGTGAVDVPAGGDLDAATSPDPGQPPADVPGGDTGRGDVAKPPSDGVGPLPDVTDLGGPDTPARGDTVQPPADVVLPPDALSDTAGLGDTAVPPTDLGPNPELPPADQGGGDIPPAPDSGSPDRCGSGPPCTGGTICCNFFGQMEMCMPPEMCPGEMGGCETDRDCRPGQVCCKFGDMAENPTCMAEAMCPRECETDADCPAHQECCDLNDTVVCLDRGQCPEKCYHASSECPNGLECCDAGDGLLICVSDAECPGSVPCEPGDVCTTSQGEPNGFTCCEVPEVGYRCVGSGGCEAEWNACTTNDDCAVGRECCPLVQGLTCVPTGACPGGIVPPTP